jgi:Ca2+-binding EF-hand superfamily protein
LATAISEVKKKRHRGKKAMTEDEVYQLLSEYFDTFDTDRDGVLAYNEILQMLRQIETNVNKKRKHKIEFDLSEAKAFFAKIDKNGDNYINKE